MNDEHHKLCQHCDGTGEAFRENGDPYRECEHCEGTGDSPDCDCSACHVPTDAELKVLMGDFDQLAEEATNDARAIHERIRRKICAWIVALAVIALFLAGVAVAFYASAKMGAGE